MSVAQIGEFSFIIASLGLTLNVTSKFLYPIAVAVSVITTLLTPYLIRSTDRVVSSFDRMAPKRLVNMLEIYTRWVGQIGSQRRAGLATRLTWQWVGQMALNAALIAGVFIAAAYVERHPPGWLKDFKLGEDMLKALLWLAAAILSLPMLIATSRKLQALGLLIAETRVSQAAAGERTAAIRAVVAQVIPIAGTVVLGLYVLVLSSALLPTLKVLIVLIFIVGVVAWLLRRAFIKVYAKGQIAILETFAQTPDPKLGHAPAPLPSLLSEADLETVTIAADSIGVGKLIRELQLRTRTGASIVGIGRNGVNVINPGPDEEMLAGDQVLLLGNRQQLDAAQALLAKHAGSLDG